MMSVMCSLLEARESARHHFGEETRSSVRRTCSFGVPREIQASTVLERRQLAWEIYAYRSAQSSRYASMFSPESTNAGGFSDDVGHACASRCV